MSETALKMIGLAVMILSVFAMLFSGAVPEDAALAGAALAWGGFVALIAGMVLYVAARDKS
ncbi:Uncharacterised protein [Slackia heliotrinireducens]|uniref:Uncharacterized protein n=1 Tax=Slackia heliotrinireducens (strain ATCC 29202 / DSM 20476 / NCTC 11029 / RHS 1) TaxID=471855 RepID=C7N0R6_SLAHD|nr:hypothetical protein [Slackia heliotrinireducens]ACV21144.1 hypothetical protein Shel_00700 [Slackia heliotrinireducens DSM 20476]VEH03838.1 Uncharacterised protein [Slackia heliotrinireducens]